MATTRTRLHAVTSAATAALTNRYAQMRASSTTRTRLRAVGAGAAFAFIVGLAGPVAASVTGETATPQSAETQSVAQAVVDAAVGADQAGAATPAAPAEAPAPAPAAAPAAPSEAELYPVGINAAQQRFVPTQEQMSNARAIVDAGKAMGLPPRAWVIAVGTALQESNLNNLGHLGDRNDHDSQGLFQQRPSSGWGTPEQITNPTYAATAFYNGLNGLTNWHTMPITQAAQKVQVSAYPDHYAKHESEAGDIIRGLYGQGPFAGIGG